MSDTVESLANYSAIVGVGAAVLWYRPQFFSFYAFVVTVGLIVHFAGRLWRFVRTSHALTNAKLLVLAKKLGVSEADYDAALAEVRKDLNWRDVERDFTRL